jgi:hypothetical protein
VAHGNATIVGKDKGEKEEVQPAAGKTEAGEIDAGDSQAENE